MQTFDGDIERLIRSGALDMNTGLAYATNPGNLQLDMSDLKLEAETESADPLLETTEK
jgi:twitching motility protein PilT